jgi:hypothetical protein
MDLPEPVLPPTDQRRRRRAGGADGAGEPELARSELLELAGHGVDPPEGVRARVTRCAPATGGELGRIAISPPIRRPASHRSARLVASIGESFPTAIRSTIARCLAREAYHPSGTDLPSNPSKRQPVGSRIVRRRRLRPSMTRHRSSFGISRRQPGSRVVIGTSPLQRRAASTILVVERPSELARLSGAPRRGSITMKAARASSA